MTSEPPEFEFYGRTEDGVFAGHLYCRRKPVAAAVMRLNPPASPEVSTARPVGRPRKTIEYITLLAHETLAKKLHPSPGVRGWVTDARNAALLLIQGHDDIGKLAYNNSRTWQKRREAALSEIEGLTVVIGTSKADATGVWMALQEPPKVNVDMVAIDSDGWLCRAGEQAKYGRIKWSAAGRWATHPIREKN